MQVAVGAVGDVEDAEIAFVDPEEVDDDQEEDVSALNDDMLAAEQEAEKAQLVFGFGDAMEMLKSTLQMLSRRNQSKKMLDQRNHLSLTLARRVSRRANRAKQNRRGYRETTPQTRGKRGFEPSGHCQKRTTFGKRQSVISTQGCWGWTGDIDFSCLTHSAHRQRQPALTQQTRNPR
ncbi:hypothetical protein [Klebsiella pneumoniae]|uniref:hypothetical protein n=1 Tax=Klebsiella pneumoniae TaxID=573 RepID=UPI00294A9577|nr:hypothetical protein [Klebsiella pneumoniae]MDV5545219.1 hypothetical protein [Klebsiella pneumoniae]